MSTGSINTSLDGKFVILQPSSAPNSYTAPNPGDTISAWTCGPQAVRTPDISRYLPGSCRMAVTQEGTFSESSS